MRELPGVHTVLEDSHLELTLDGDALGMGVEDYVVKLVEQVELQPDVELCLLVDLLDELPFELAQERMGGSKSLAEDPVAERLADVFRIFAESLPSGEIGGLVGISQGAE